MYIVLYHELVMCSRMMLSEIVTHIGVTSRPTYIELVLFNPVFNPVKYHFHCLEALFLDCIIDYAIYGGVVSFDLGGVLFVDHFNQFCARESAFFSIHKDGTKLGLSNGRYHMFEYFCMAKKWDIGQGGD
jgi:hypothetical protein